MQKKDISKQQVKTANKDNGFKTAVKSVGAAFFGVQSNKNRERDFSQGKLKHFIVAGILGVALFIGVLISIVSLVLP